MRTERRKTSLDNVSQNYQERTQLDRERKDRQTNGGVSPSPTVGIIVGGIGTVGSMIAWLKGTPALIAALVAVAGCVGALICRGSNGDYDSLSARICIGAAVVSAIAGIIILTFYFKGLGIWEFASGM